MAEKARSWRKVASTRHFPAPTILQRLPFSSYFVSSYFFSPDTFFHAYSQPFFRLCPTEAIISLLVRLGSHFAGTKVLARILSNHE
jgi:hypothetical protein